MSTLATVHGRGTLAARPAAGNAGRLYFATDSPGTLYRDNGSSWDSVETTASGGSGIPAGTAFPGTPATNDQFFRTDRGIAYYYDGTRWLSMVLYDQPVTLQDNLTSMTASTTLRVAHPSPDYTIWREKLHGGIYVATTNNASNYWTIAQGAISFNTSGQAADVLKTGSAVINATLTPTDQWLQVDVTKTGAPGAVFPAVGITYRLVG